MKALLTCLLVGCCAQLTFSAVMQCGCGELTFDSEREHFCEVNFVAQVRVTNVTKTSTPTITRTDENGNVGAVMGNAIPTVYRAKVLRTFRDTSSNGAANLNRLITFSHPFQACEVDFNHGQEVIIAGNRTITVVENVSECNLWNQQSAQRLEMLKDGDLPTC